jgi:hypothetical protein
MDDALMTVPSVATLAREAQANTDQQLIALWLHGRPASTQRRTRVILPGSWCMLRSRYGLSPWATCRRLPIPLTISPRRPKHAFSVASKVSSPSPTALAIYRSMSVDLYSCRRARTR